MIRPAEVDETAQIHRLISSVLGGSLPDDLTWLADRVLSDSGIVLVDHHESCIIGAIVGHVVTDEAEIHDVVIQEQSRRSGRGLQLVVHFERLAQSMGAEKIFLEVRTDNHPAIKLYTRLHYTRSGYRPAYYSDGQDALVMCKDLKAAK